MRFIYFFSSCLFKLINEMYGPSAIAMFTSQGGTDPPGSMRIVYSTLILLSTFFTSHCAWENGTRTNPFISG